MRNRRASERTQLGNVALVGVVIALSMLFMGMPATGAGAQTTEVVGADGARVSVTAVSAEQLGAAAGVPQPSIQELEAFYLLKLKRRGEVPDAPLGGAAPGAESSAGPSRETEVMPGDDAGQFHGAPGALVIGRNLVNARANDLALGSTLAEPAAANNGSHIFAAGNLRHAEKTLNGAAPFVNVPLPGGPADATIVCCDHDVVIDDARRVLFHSALYIPGATSDGVVRIFVWRTISQAAANCSYDIRLTNGTDTTVLPDFPHMGLTKKHLYLSLNGVGSSVNIIRYMIRFQLDQLVDCVAAPALQFFSQGPTGIDAQRAWTPAQGTNNHDAMYWGQMNPTCLRLAAACTSFQIFRWLDGVAAAAGPFTRVISASRHNITSDCRGGVGNFNFITGIATDARGFTLRGAVAPGALSDGRDAVGFWWNANPSGNILQGHVRAAIFESVGLGLFNEPHIFNQGFCFAYPNVSSSKRGDFGLHIAFGGKAGGLGSAASTAVGTDDEFSAGVGVFLSPLTGVLNGTHNRTDGRYGDYHTVRPHEPCEKWFNATSYVLVGGTGVANVVSRYLEFGRNVNFRCWRNNAFGQPVN